MANKITVQEQRTYWCDQCGKAMDRAGFSSRLQPKLCSLTKTYGLNFCNDECRTTWDKEHQPVGVCP